MARVSPEELVERLEKGKLIPAVLLLGEEAYLRDACRAQLIDRFVPEALRTWAVSRYSAGRGETQAALDQAQTMVMLSPRQVKWRRWRWRGRLQKNRKWNSKRAPLRIWRSS